MAKNNKKCILCGREYRYCPSCKEHEDKPIWMNSYCSESCKDLFLTATDYLVGLVTKEQMKAVIDRSDLSRRDTFHNGVAKIIDELISMKETIEKEEVSIDDDVVVEKNEEVSEKKQYIKSKRMKNKKNEDSED